jgi:hypothetical protein
MIRRYDTYRNIISYRLYHALVLQYAYCISRSFVLFEKYLMSIRVHPPNPSFSSYLTSTIVRAPMYVDNGSALFPSGCQHSKPRMTLRKLLCWPSWEGLVYFTKCIDCWTSILLNPNNFRGRLIWYYFEATTLNKGFFITRYQK